MSSFYIEATDLQAVIPPEEYLQMFDRTNDPQTTPDATIVAAAIDAGEARLHKALARRYQLPLSTADLVLFKFIKPIVVDYAREAGYPRPDMVPDDLVKRNAEHDAELQDVRDGKADLPAQTPPPAASSDSKILWSNGGSGRSCLP